MQAKKQKWKTQKTLGKKQIKLIIKLSPFQKKRNKKNKRNQNNRWEINKRSKKRRYNTKQNYGKI